MLACVPCTHTHAHAHTHRHTMHHISLPIDLRNIKRLKCYMLLLGIKLVCLTSNKNYDHTQKCVLTFGLILSRALHIQYNLNALRQPENFFTRRDSTYIQRGSKTCLQICSCFHPSGEQALSQPGCNFGFVSNVEINTVQVSCVDSLRLRQRRIY